MGYGAIIQALMSMAGSAQAGAMTEEQIALQKAQLAKLAGIPLPQLEHIAAAELPPSHVAALGIDTGLRQNQLENIAALKDIAAHGGMSLEDQVAQEAAMSRAAGSANRGRAAIAGDLASRGQLDSGARLQMAMNAEQQNANSARQSGMEAAANAQRRRMEALREIASESGGLRNQDFAQKSAAAQAADERDRWNASAAEKAKYYNAGLPQQQFANQITQVTGQGPAVQNLASSLGQEAQGTRNAYAGYGAALGAGVDNLTRGSGSSDQNTYEWDPKIQKDISGERGGYQDLSEDDYK